MCGICGILTRNVSLVPDRGLLERMRDLIAHRGPDGAGLHLGPGVGLGHRRLSIVDLAQGQQPMYSHDRRFVIVYNGEVFNHPALKTELEAAGVRYRTHSDTETVLHLYERMGERAVERMTLLAIDEGIDTGPVYGYYRYPFDAMRESHVRIQHRVFLENVDAIRERLLAIAAGRAAPLPVAKVPSHNWGQPWLSAYLRYRRKLRVTA